MKRTRGTGSLKLRGKTWWIVYSHHGRPYSESAKSEDIQEAKKLLAKRLGQIASGEFAGPALEKVTIADLADLVIEDYMRSQKRSLDDYMGRRIGAHLKGCERACKEAGLEGLRFHDLRRSAIRNMERAGIPM